MEKGKWTNIKAVETEIIKMRKAERTRQEIADALGLEKVQIKNWINRYNRGQARLSAGLPPKRRGRPWGNGYTTIKECQYEIQHLKIENKLLRDFLRFTGRK